MSIQFDETGLTIQNLLEILGEREGYCKSVFGDDFYITGESAIANLQSSDADRELDIQELLLFVANQLDPNQAEGIWLDYICALNNITRYKATKTIIPITVSGVAGTAKNAGEIIIVDETTDEYFINEEAFVVGEDGTINANFIATSYGAINVVPSSTFYLKTPSIGISSVSYNQSGSMIIGRDTETDEELRERRIESITYTATSILSSIRASVSQVSGVQYLNIYENDTSSTVDSIPAKSFEVVVRGGDEDEIAKAILLKKPAGIQAYGTTTKTVKDEDDNSFIIGFTRPTELQIDINLTFNSDTSQSDEWKAMIKNELAEAFTKIYNVGDSIYIYNLYYVLNNHPEIKNVTEFEIKLHSETEWATSIAIGKRQLGMLSTENITITQSA